MKLIVLKHPWRNEGYCLRSATHTVVGEARHLMENSTLAVYKPPWSPSCFNNKKEAQEYVDKLELADLETPTSIKRFFGAKY